METLHEGAHVSFKALIMARGYFNHKSLVMTPERFADYIKSIATKFTYMRGMFEAHKPREHVLDGIQALYRPASYWQEQQRIIRDSSKNE